MILVLGLIIGGIIFYYDDVSSTGVESKDSEKSLPISYIKTIEDRFARKILDLEEAVRSFEDCQLGFKEVSGKKYFYKLLITDSRTQEDFLVDQCGPGFRVYKIFENGEADIIYSNMTLGSYDFITSKSVSFEGDILRLPWGRPETDAGGTILIDIREGTATFTSPWY